MFMLRHLDSAGIEQFDAARDCPTNAATNAVNKLTFQKILIGWHRDAAESSAAIMYAELDADDNYYVSITIPSLIVATFGGGTGLATQNECLQIVGYSGAGKVDKLAEIIGGVVLAGELSLSSAVLAGDWVSSHNRLGRNR